MSEATRKEWRDAEIAREQLAAIEEDPSQLVSGEELEEALARLLEEGSRDRADP